MIEFKLAEETNEPVDTKITLHAFDDVQMQDNQITLAVEEPKASMPRLHFKITDFYNLRKVKYTLDFGDSLSNKQLVKS